MNDTLEVLLFQSGNTVVLKDEEQVPELQVSWLTLYAAFLEGKGIKLDKVTFTLPSGQRAQVFKSSSGDYNWRFKGE